MDSTFRKIDIAKVDRDIDELYRQVKILESVKKYALDNSEDDYKEINLISHNDVHAKVDKSTQIGVGVSEFIITLLGDGGRIDTKDVIRGFAKNTHKEYTEVSGNVSNALSRLKKLGKIDNQVKPGGRKSGSLWFLKSNN